MGQCWLTLRRRVRELNPCCGGDTGHNRYTEFAPQDKMKYSDETLLHQINSGRTLADGNTNVLYEAGRNEEAGAHINDYADGGEQYRGTMRLPQHDDEDGMTAANNGYVLQGGGGGTRVRTVTADSTVCPGIDNSYSVDDIRSSLVTTGAEFSSSGARGESFSSTGASGDVPTTVSSADQLSS